ncbi:MAG: DUF4446 family protein [Lachnospiraceae bacterium]|nr:DUF4446 family protein [Lachnospiraceae bacterium]
MQSSILNSMGLGGTDPAIWLIILFALSLLIIIILIAVSSGQKKKILALTERVDDLTSGEDGKSLEAELDQIIADNKKLLEDTDKNTRDISTIYGRLKNVYQKMAIVKYDAYEQLGGEMSAVVVILDEKNNGVLINNVYSTEGGYVYTREIENGKCKHELGAEEQQALTEAIHK